MRVLLTGATGFLGEHLVRACLERGWFVRAFARATSKTEKLEARGVEVVRGSLERTEDLVEPAGDVDAIVHAAGGGMSRDPRDIYRANTDTTRTILNAAPTRLKRFVLVSSLAAHGPSNSRPSVESDPPRPRSHYGKSKLAAERIALRFADRFPVTALRPPALYGAGEHRMVELFRAARRGVLPMVHPEGRLSMLHGADCADAIVRALDVEHPSGTYFVAERRIYTRREMAQCIGAAVGSQVRLIPLPAVALHGIAALAESIAAVRGKPLVLSRDKARDAAQRDQTCDPSKAMAALGWTPQRTFEEGAREAHDDYVARGWL